MTSPVALPEVAGLLSLRSVRFAWRGQGPTVIAHVQLAISAKGYRAMDTVWE